MASAVLGGIVAALLLLAGAQPAAPSPGAAAIDGACPWPILVGGTEVDIHSAPPGRWILASPSLPARDAVQRVLVDLGPEEVRVTRRFDTLPFLGAWLSEDALRWLCQDAGARRRTLGGARRQPPPGGGARPHTAACPCPCAAELTTLISWVEQDQKVSLDEPE